MKAACDIDGVLADVIDPLRLSILKECGYDIEGRITSYDFYKSIPGLTLSTWHDIVDSTLSCQKDIRPYADAISYFPLIHNDNMVFLTARRVEFIDETATWLRRTFNIIPNVISRSSSNKLQYLLDNKFNILIEDRLRTANQTADYMNVFLINRPWNIGRETHQNVIRVDSFKEIAKILLK